RGRHVTGVQTRALPISRYAGERTVQLFGEDQRDEGPRTHVRRLLLDPQDLARVRVGPELLTDLLDRQRVQTLRTDDGGVLVPVRLTRGVEVVVDLARAENDPTDLLRFRS